MEQRSGSQQQTGGAVPCTVCSNWINNAHLDVHVAHHLGYNPFRCLHCHAQMPNFDFLQSHALEQGHLPLKYLRNEDTRVKKLCQLLVNYVRAQSDADPVSRDQQLASSSSDDRATTINSLGSEMTQVSHVLLQLTCSRFMEALHAVTTVSNVLGSKELQADISECLSSVLSAYKPKPPTENVAQTALTYPSSRRSGTPTTSSASQLSSPASKKGSSTPARDIVFPAHLTLPNCVKPSSATSPSHNAAVSNFVFMARESLKSRASSMGQQVPRSDCSVSPLSAAGTDSDEGDANPSATPKSKSQEQGNKSGSTAKDSSSQLDTSMPSTGSNGVQMARENDINVTKGGPPVVMDVYSLANCEEFDLTGTMVKIEPGASTSPTPCVSVLPVSQSSPLSQALQLRSIVVCKDCNTTIKLAQLPYAVRILRLVDHVYSHLNRIEETLNDEGEIESLYYCRICMFSANRHIRMANHIADHVLKDGESPEYQHYTTWVDRHWPLFRQKFVNYFDKEWLTGLSVDLAPLVITRVAGQKSRDVEDSDELQPEVRQSARRKRKLEGSEDVDTGSGSDIEVLSLSANLRPRRRLQKRDSVSPALSSTRISTRSSARASRSSSAISGDSGKHNMEAKKGARTDDEEDSTSSGSTSDGEKKTHTSKTTSRLTKTKNIDHVPESQSADHTMTESSDHHAARDNGAGPASVSSGDAISPAGMSVGSWEDPFEAAGRIPTEADFAVAVEVPRLPTPMCRQFLASHPPGQEISKNDFSTTGMRDSQTDVNRFARISERPQSVDEEHPPNDGIDEESEPQTPIDAARPSRFGLESSGGSSSTAKPDAADRQERRPASPDDDLVTKSTGHVTVNPEYSDADDVTGDQSQSSSDDEDRGRLCKICWQGDKARRVDARLMKGQRQLVEHTFRHMRKEAGVKLYSLSCCR